MGRQTAMTETVTIRGGTFEVWECKSCGVIATAPKVLRDEHRRVGGYCFCPNGHQWGWHKEESEEARIRRERDRFAQQIAQRDDDLRIETARRETAEREVTAARKKLASLKKRAAAGVCPCCNRTFIELQKHMASKHPTFRAEDAGHENIVSLVKARA